jgi:hypothetical protein
MRWLSRRLPRVPHDAKRVSLLGRCSNDQDVSFNASYLLALVQAWQRKQAGAPGLKYHDR